MGAARLFKLLAPGPVQPFETFREQKMQINLSWLALVPIVLTGCAERILSAEESFVIGSSAATSLSVASKRQDDSLLGQASQLADKLASAYFSAGVKASRAQDVVNAGVYLSAGSVVLGALGSTSDRILTNRALAGVGLQSIGQNGLQKAEVQSLFVGAKQLNCISGVTSIYSSTSAEIADSSIAQHLAFSAMQDVRISARNALVRDVESFADVLRNFTDVVQSNDDETESGRTADSTSLVPLNAFATKLGTCISSK